MNSTRIPYMHVPKSTALFLDYLYHYDRVARFYNGSPFDFASYSKVAEGLRGIRQDRREVAEILIEQNRTFGCGKETFGNIQRLADSGTLAVVTGQQVGLLSGPAFTLYKALTAIRLAQHLSEQGLPAVPVFWLASEDHDLEEVAEAATLDEEYNLVPLTDSGERPAPRSSVGYVKLSTAIARELDRLEATLPAGEPREHLLADLRASYQPGATWGQAFGRFMARLFSRWGVVLIDPLDESVHRLCAAVYELAVARAPELRARLAKRGEALVQAGYHAQVHVAEDSTLIFVTREGNRLPLHHRGEGDGKAKDGDFFLDESLTVSLPELKRAVKDRPLDFTPNALLRPIVQDTLLPTLASVAGPSELAYLGQAQALYEVFGRPQPVIFPRAAFTLVDRRAQRLMEKYGVDVEDVWQGEEHLRRKIAANGLAGGWSERLDGAEREFAQVFDGLRRDVEALDPTLLDTLKHAQEKMTYQMDRLKGKISRAALERSELLSRHQQALSRLLMPARSLQEREVSGVYFLGRAGYELLDHILSQIQTRSSDHQVLAYQDSRL